MDYADEEGVERSETREDDVEQFGTKMGSEEEMTSYLHKGIIPLFPDIMNQLPPNSTQCICSDLQHEDYSPLYAWFNYVLIILALPSLSVFGVLTNVVNVFVYSRKRMQNSANTYLLFLGCSDFLVILTGLFIFWIDSARSYIQELARAPYTTVYTLPFGYMAQTCSIYFTVAAAFDCYINVCWKNIAHHYCTVRRAKQICACVTICSIIYNSLRFPQFNLRKCFHDGSQEIIIEICPTTLFFTINTIYNVYMYMVLMTLLPFLFLLVLNAFIVVRQSIGSRNVSTSASQNFCIERTPSDFTTAKASTMGILEANGSVTTKTGASFQDGSGDDTLTMIMVVVLFLCCNTLALIVNMIETFFNPDPLLLNLLSDASNFLVIFNSSVNCVIYMIFNKEYRETFLLHAGRLLDFLKHQCGCCLSPRRATHGASFREHRLLYKPIASPTITSVEAAPKKRPDSLMREANNPQKHTEYGSCHSPVWQPLTSSSGLQNAALPLGEFWSAPFCCDQLATATSALTSPAPSFDPAPPSSSPDFVLADDDGVDSGCDDSQYSKSPTRIRKVQKSWIAEVKILESGDKPHILVKPISGFKPDGISITAL